MGALRFCNMRVEDFRRRRGFVRRLQEITRYGDGIPWLRSLSRQSRRKTARPTILGLALEPVRNGIGIETMRFGPGRHVIGSSAECSHNLLTAGVQPRHCEIRLEAGHATLRALDFRTWLNNGPVRQAELRPGDRLIVGPLEFRVSVEAGASSFAPRSRIVRAPRSATSPVPASALRPRQRRPLRHHAGRRPPRTSLSKPSNAARKWKTGWRSSKGSSTSVPATSMRATG